MITAIPTLTELKTLCHERLFHAINQAMMDIPYLPFQEAMHYALKNGGKALRPLLVYATGLCFNTPLTNLDAPAAAIHLIHTYSLIHDDLPCMDDADMRRHLPTCHKVYGEGVAVLLGDALLTLALQILARHPAPLSAEKRVAMMGVLTESAGAAGMIAGQAMDIAEDAKPDLATLLQLYALKTGKLLAASLSLGMLAADNINSQEKEVLSIVGKKIGLAFQIQDDLLDLKTENELTGKPSGIDDKNNKFTYVSLVGKTAAENEVNTLYTQAADILANLGSKASLLQALLDWMRERRS